MKEILQNGKKRKDENERPFCFTLRDQMEEDERTGRFRKSMKEEVKPISYSQILTNAINIKKQEKDR